MAKLPVVLSTPEDLRKWRKTLNGRVGFVPTMGALHEGHATLLRKVRPRCDVSVLSIFVNPTQFGPNEDLSRYPKTWERDLEIAAQEGVDAVFAPLATEMYPTGFSTYVEETLLSQPLCGRFRPGHFRGVTTVVLKLFNLVKPHLALFGLKDAQQFFVLERMVRDLDLDFMIEGVATVRESDGLALSSRNAYLSPKERSKAPRLFQTLKELQRTWTADTGLEREGALESVKSQLQEEGFQVQYLEALSLPSFEPLSMNQKEVPGIIAIAAFLGKTRLIDNVLIRPEHLNAQGYRLQLET